MKFHKQTKLHIPGKQNGNCYAATIACLLDKEICEVPNVEVLFWLKEDDLLWSQVMSKFLLGQGYHLRGGDEFKVFHPELNRMNDSESNELRKILKDKYYLVSGKSTRGNWDHITIWQNGRMVHDSHPDNSGILTLEIFEFLEKI